ncbi:MAG TPA: prepilin-type N-terminal cleavage/methylation domain-containing protein [Terriglobales bacterium]|nr:prepilin-type N-terminal cleavage/methylation domain-containing protein [Terriglobales bacterium]
MRHKHSNPRRNGFSMLELVIVVAIMLAVSAAALPSFFNSIETYRMRTAAMDVEGLMQRARSLAIRDNKYYAVRSVVANQGGINYTQVFVDLNNNGVQNNGERLIQLPVNMSLPNGGNPAMPNGTLGFAPQGAAVPVMFNNRGLPCVMKAGICSNWDAGNTPVGFVVFLQDAKTSGNGWAAISVSPVGRAKVWSWNSASSTWKY